MRRLLVLVLLFASLMGGTAYAQTVIYPARFGPIATRADFTAGIDVSNWFRLATISTSAPAGADCNEVGETGRQHWDSTSNVFSLCSGVSGWWPLAGLGANSFTADQFVSGGFFGTQIGVTGVFAFLSYGGGAVSLRDWAGTGAMDRLCLGPCTAAFPALRTSGTSLEVRLADNSSYGNFGANVITSNNEVQSAKYTSVTAGTGTLITNVGQSVSNDAVISLGTAAVIGFVFVINETEASGCQFLLRGGAGVIEVSDPDALCTAAAGGAGTINVYWSADNSRYELENKRGSTRAIRIVRIGI